MLRRDPTRAAPTSVQPISDAELGVAALLLGVVLVLATLLVPALG
jgi:hypothetical protein